MFATEIKLAILHEYRWLYRLALAREDYFLAEYYSNLIDEEIKNEN